jgi:hypothetical protein
MSTLEGIEPLNLLPDRFEAASFSPKEARLVLGESADRQLSRDNFNWLGAYLVEQVGLHEGEVEEWFKSSAWGLDGQRPLDVWQSLDGFEQVLDYAKAYKGYVDEALEHEDIEAVTDPLLRSHSIANRALDTILKSFEVAGVDLQPHRMTPLTRSYALHNPKKPTAPMVRWKGNGTLEDYRITRTEGEHMSMYYIVRHLSLENTPMILQSGIVEFLGHEMQESSSDSDLNGRAPSASEVAMFVVPLASEIKRRDLRPITR